MYGSLVNHKINEPMDVFSVAPALTSNQCDLAMANYKLSDLPQEFQDKITPLTETGCWLWIGAINKAGYGTLGGARAHIIVYEMLVGKVPKSLELDHLCRVKSCVNPNHLDPVSHAENMRRWNATRTHCIRGHLLEGDNVRPNNTGVNRRYCVECGEIRYLATIIKKEGKSREIRHKNMTHCPHGHEYSGYNLVVNNGRRGCRQCGVERVRARRKRLKQEGIKWWQ